MYPAWLDDIWDKLQLTYGQGFLRRYDGIDIASVKANWHHELAPFLARPTVFAFALSHLPADAAPTVLQFVELCRAAPRVEEFPALPAPTVDAAGVKRIAARLRSMRPEKPNDPKAWAYRLSEREERSGGKGMTLVQRKAWREALGELQPGELH
jgi:hypothetical protein